MARKKTGFPPEVVEMVLARSEGMCEVMLARCCAFTAVEIQHRVARGAGGTRRREINGAANGLAVCRNCHRRIEDNPREGLRRGWRLPQWTDGQPTIPAEHWVSWRGQHRWLSDDGTFWEPTPRDHAQARERRLDAEYAAHQERLEWDDADRAEAEA